MTKPLLPFVPQKTGYGLTAEMFTDLSLIIREIPIVVIVCSMLYI